MIASLYVRYTGFTNSLDSGPLRSDTANTLLGKSAGRQAFFADSRSSSPGCKRGVKFDSVPHWRPVMSPTATALELKSCPLYINGKPVISRGVKDIQRSPATGEAVAEIPRCTPEEISAAVASALTAFGSWSKTPVLQRCRILFKYRELLESRADELIALVTEENGKTLDEAKGSFQRGIECVEFACGAPTLMMGDTVDRVGTGVDAWSTRHAIGVCVGITPFNFPVMVPLWMFPMAIACGNTFVLKPSDKVPRTSVRLVEIAHQAGLPPGVLNLVHGAQDTVDQLLTYPQVQAVSFVGSSAVARYIYQTAA